jgi:hypothetical protein
VRGDEMGQLLGLLVEGVGVLAVEVERTDDLLSDDKRQQ